MPRLTITYRDRVLFDGEIRELSWQETDTALLARAKMGVAPPVGTGLIGILEKAMTAQRDKAAGELPSVRKPNTPDLNGDNGQAPHPVRVDGEDGGP